MDSYTPSYHITEKAVGLTLGAITNTFPAELLSCILDSVEKDNSSSFTRSNSFASSLSINLHGTRENVLLYC